MKKTVQIVAVPLNKQGYNKKDLCKKVGMVWEGDSKPIGTYVIAVKDNVSEEVNEYWQAQQLLVLSSNNEELASYPHIEGTLPISKETVQAWIDSGMPDSAEVKKKTGEQGNLILQFPSKDQLLKEQQDAQSAMWSDAEDKALIEEAFKPKQVPTDEEIDAKGREVYFRRTGVVFAEESRTDMVIGYREGYKQALKDMGYE